VLFEAVVWSQVEPATEPPDRLLAVAFSEEQAEVRVACRRIRISRMHDQRDRNRVVARAGELGTPRGRGGRQVTADGVRKIHGGALQDGSVRKHPRPREAASVAVDALAMEADLSVFLLERGRHAVLVIEEKRLDRRQGFPSGHLSRRDSTRPWR